MGILKKLSYAVHTIGTICLGFIFISVVINVILRIFGTSLGSWVEEMSGYAVVWATYLGMAYTLREGKHVRVDLLTEKLSPKRKAAVGILAEIATVIFGGIVTYFGAMLAYNAYLSERVTPLSGFPVYILLLALPTGMLLFTLESLEHGVKLVRNLVTRRVEDENKELVDVTFEI